VDWFADLLFEKEYPTFVVQAARRLPIQHDSIKTFIVQLWEQYHEFFLLTNAARLAAERDQTFAKLAGDLLEYSFRPRTETLVLVSNTARERALRELELDGYQWDGERLVHLEENVFDVGEQESTLLREYRSAELNGADRIAKELGDVDDQYVSEKWGDCIKHARDLLELTLDAVARGWAGSRGEELPKGAKERPVVIREYLQKTTLIDERERGFLDALWRLLSEQGGHPNMSERESARICRQYALSAAHFVLLRYGARRSESKPA
jgi:hypothetical protein